MAETPFWLLHPRETARYHFHESTPKNVVTCTRRALKKAAEGMRATRRTPHPWACRHSFPAHLLGPAYDVNTVQSRVPREPLQRRENHDHPHPCAQALTGWCSQPRRCATSPSQRLLRPLEQDGTIQPFHAAHVTEGHKC
jgi:hypothetical protein